VADINLTTTAVSPMTTNLTSMRTVLRQELHDADAANYRWQDSILNRHLARAVRELSLVLPREQKTALNTTAGSRSLSISSLSDLVRIEAVEFPTGAWPPVYVQFSVYETTLTLLLDGVPASVEPVNVYWGKLHTLDVSTSTLPPSAEDVVVTGAAAYAALEWASFATNRANVSGTAAFENYQAWGEERLRQFREALRAFGREARVRNATLYRTGGEASRNTVQWPG
jgi:hypothetical protein